MSAVPNMRPKHLLQHVVRQTIRHTGEGRYPRPREGGKRLRAWTPAFAGVAHSWSDAVSSPA